MPYQPHPSFKTPEDRVAIWRYMDLAKLCALLVDKALYFCSPAVLAQADPFEGQPFLHIDDIRRDLTTAKDDDINRITHSDFARKSTFVAYLEKNSLTLQQYLRSRWSTFMHANFVNCWHMNDDESQAMWKIYAGENAGIAVQSTVGRLKEALRKVPFPVCLGEITYVDRDQYVRQWEGASRSPYMFKRKEFEYEREMRALISGEHNLKIRYIAEDGSDGDENSRTAHVVEPIDPGLAGQFVSVDVNTLIERLVISPRCSAWFPR
jgi:hypothetical protein